MKKIRIIKHRVAALLMSLVIALGCISPAFSIKAKAEALEVANGACTVADIIMSYCAGSGVAVLNDTVINQVYNTFGSSYGTVASFVSNGLLTYVDGAYVDTGLSTSIESTLSSVSSLDIGAIFSQTAQESSTGVALTAGASLSGIAGAVASTGFLPVAAGVAVTGWAGFQLGTCLAHMMGLYGETAYNGAPVNRKQFFDGMAEGYNGIFYQAPGDSSFAFKTQCNRIIAFNIKNSNIYFFVIGATGNKTDYYSPVERFKKQFGLTEWGGYLNGYPYVWWYTSGLDPHYAVPYGGQFNSQLELTEYLRKLYNGEVEPNIKSPDLVGDNGNIAANKNGDNYVFTNTQNNVDPSTQRINPTGINKQGWLDYANNADNNFNNGTPENNSEIYDAIFGDLVEDQPTPVPTPEPEPNPDPNPAPNPETVPAPDLNPYPDNYPIAVPEDVPADKPQPDYTEKQTENETDITEGDPYTTPNLLNKFPFCIPRDILQIFQKLNSGSREAPHIIWRFNPNSMIDYTFDIDFSMFNNVASLLRLLELLAFIVALGVATRNLILS